METPCIDETGVAGAIIILISAWANFEMWLVLCELLILWWLDAHTGWAKNRRIRRRVLLVSALTLLPLQAGLAYDFQSYGEGPVPYLGPVTLFSESYVAFDIQPGELLRVGSISNFYTVAYLWARIESRPSSATFFLMDENTPQVRHELGNYSQDYLEFRLPYRYSCPFVVANWTANLYNPSQNESIYGHVVIFPSQMEDADYLARRQINFSHGWPLIVTLTLWLYTGSSMVHGFWSFEQKKLRMAEMHQTQ